MENLTDSQLINAYLKGKKDALDILINRYLKLVYTFIFRLVGNAADAEDITQEVFVKVWRNLKQFDQQKSFKPWIFRIAKNACVDFWRRRKNIAFSAMNWDDNENDFAAEIADTRTIAAGNLGTAKPG
jgi:RNA polymerase sigma-70 factor, ECF subfamily